MNEQTNQLLRDLAEKLGTTSEYLWAALMRQAPISGTVNLLVIALWIIAMYWTYRLLIRKTKKPPISKSDPYPISEMDSDSAYWGWVAWWISAVLLAFTVGCSMEMIVASLFNPEYWSLKQLLKQ